MALYRLSAAENLGLPVRDLNEVNTREKIFDYMVMGGIEPELVQGMEFEDVTPPYLTEDELAYRFMVTTIGPDEAMLDLMPFGQEIEPQLVRDQNFRFLRGSFGGRTIFLPQEMSNFSIGAPSPGHAGKYCIHELFIDK